MTTIIYILSILGKGGLSKLNEQGISLIETMLSVSILFLLTISLLPLTHSMGTHIENEKMASHAGEVAYNGARTVQLYGEMSGVQQIDGHTYMWEFVNHSICVTYHNLTEDETLCVEG